MHNSTTSTRFSANSNKISTTQEKKKNQFAEVLVTQLTILQDWIEFCFSGELTYQRIEF